MTKLLHFLRRDDGPTSIEYAVMMALIIVACIGAITVAGNKVASVWVDSRQAIETAIDE